MPNYDKIIEKILSGKSDANIKFNDVKNLLIFLGFEIRIKGSHHIFRKEGIKELVNIQKDGKNAKPYQIRQIRFILVEYDLIEEQNG